MQKIKLKEAIERVKELLTQTGKSEKTLKMCNKGLRIIVRFFEERNIDEIDSKQVDDFLLEMHNEHISGRFGIEKWRVIRRCCEMIKQYSSEETIDIGSLSRWDYSRGLPMQYIASDPPTVEQIAECGNIYALAWRVRQELISAGLASNTVRHYSEEGLSVIIRYHYAHGTKYYSKKLTDSLVSNSREKYEKGSFRRQAYQNIRKTAWLINEIYETGKIALETIPKWSLRYPTAEFSALLSDFCITFISENRLKESSVYMLASKIRRFIFALEDSGINSIESLSPVLVNTTVTELAKNYPSGAGNLFYPIRLFLQFLYEKGAVVTDLSVALPEAAATKKTFHEPLTDDEIKCLLEAPDRSTPIGKRDYAIMLLALQTGLRACDISDLRRENIDWKSKTVNIVQHKTGVPLSLPLPSEAGNAVADYLLHGRPVCDLPHIFICDVGKKRPIKSRTFGTVVTKYMKRTGIYDTERRRGFHSFRRTFGTSLLKNDIPMDLIQQMLGHTQMNSMKPYLSVEEEGLKRCALSLVFGREEAHL